MKKRLLPITLLLVFLLSIAGCLSSQHSKSNHSKLSHLLLRPRMSF